MSNATYADPNGNTSSTTLDASQPRAEDAKRHLIAALEDLRERSAAAREAATEAILPDRDRAAERLREALRHDPDLLVCVEALCGAGDATELRRALRISEETCKMLEETVQGFEGRLLDAIAENGRLHKRAYELKDEVMDLRATAASVTRQRDELRSRVDDLRHRGVQHREALSAAEREILFLNERLLRLAGAC
ncbi:MAG: hypothetical protein ACOCX4_09965 [Planctomycetota bacterium]